MSDIVYPQGCKPIREDLGSDELIRRLKVSNLLAIKASNAYNLKKKKKQSLFCRI